MKKLIKIMFLVVFVSGVAAAVASVISKKKLVHMSDEEIRGYLSSKLEGKVGADQLGSIQDAVIAGVRRGTDAGTPSAEYVEEVEEAVADLADVAEEAADESAEATSDAAEEAAEVDEEA